MDKEPRVKYEVVIQEAGKKPHFTGLRFGDEHLDSMRKRIYPPFRIVRIEKENLDPPNFRDALTGYSEIDRGGK